MTDRLPSLPEISFSTRARLIGAAVGLGIGLLAARMYVRAAEENQLEEPGKIGTMDVLRLTIALVAIVRQITEMASKD